MSSFSRSDSSPLLSSCRHLLQGNGSVNGEQVARTILPLFGSLAAALVHSSAPALGCIDGRSPITHDRIREFILQEFGPSLHHFGFGKGHRIAVVLPNGPELALNILAICNWATCVPLNANGANSELKADILRCQAHVIFGPADTHVFGGGFEVDALARELNLPFVGLVPSETEAGIFHLRPPILPNNGSSVNLQQIQQPLQIPLSPVSHISTSVSHISTTDAEADVSAGGPSTPRRSAQEQEDYHARVDRFLANSHDDHVLLLFTSGTTGSKKIVPHCLGEMLVAASIISLSWNLQPTDVNCNLMPLFHVGGIVRQVFSPVLSGGCVICCPAFDPATFWELLEQRKFTWYYAAPTMHHLLLQSQPSHIHKVPPLKMIANAAGGLLPSLARQLRDTFQAHVLPSYGMTECMPIASPPWNYNLEKPGTSGVAVGPQVKILNLTTLKELPHGTEGPICVRGSPCFRGYEQNKLERSANQHNHTTFLEGGWFNTGDLGYMDRDGYLYITGRSKEVINRGGEIISPMEVEEAVLSHEHVQACAAFSALHNVLQEVVGIVLVMHPNRPRLDLHSLHEYLADDKLINAKWPQCLVFMDALPKSHTNKLLRVKLGQRLGLPELNDSMVPLERTFQAKCPPQGTPLSNAIPSEQVTVSAALVQVELARVLVTDVHEQQLWVVPHPTRIGSLVCHIYQIGVDRAIQVARETLHQYAVPSHFVKLEKQVLEERNLPFPKPHDSVFYILQNPGKTDGSALAETKPADKLVADLQQSFLDLLDLDCLPSPETNFFQLGGSSMMASQLASKVRKQHEVMISGAEVFHHPTCVAMAALIRERKEHQQSCVSPASGSISRSSSHSQAHQKDGDSQKSASVAEMSLSTIHPHKTIDTRGVPFEAKRLAPRPSLWASLFQLVPLTVVYPIWQVSRLFLFFSFLTVTLKRIPEEHNLIPFVLTLVAFHFCWVTFTPLLFVIIKWIVIGRYEAGRYPIWSGYYLRWWFVDVCRKLIGRGIWGSNRPLLNTYYRLLGANIGPGAGISLEADIAEYDLVSIGHEAAVEYSTVRAFGVDNGSMILGPVSVGNNASVGARSVVAPYSKVPDNCHLGPAMSSYETGKSLDAKHKRVNRQALPEPSLWAQVLVGGPISFAVDAISHIPAFLVLWWMVSSVGSRYEGFRDMSDLIRWLCDPRRIPFYIGVRVARAIVAPFVYMGTAILVKWFVIGKFQPGPRDTTSEWQLLRHWLSATLFSRENMQEVTDLIGRHYELVSCLYRLLGAKVGKRVFWPGSQPVFSGEFELLEIGDDVVFGSRSTILCTTADSCEKVILCAGSNVSDNCVVLPGSIVGKNAVLGSNTVCPEGWFLPESSLWFGCKEGCEPVCLEKGVDGDVEAPLRAADVKVDQLVMEGDESTLRPFGRAFYQGEASYFVCPLASIIITTLLIQVFIATFHTLPLLGALHAGAGVLYGFPIAERDYWQWSYSFSTVYLTLLLMFVGTHTLRVGLWWAIDWGSKWLFMGQRQEGRYNYDQSSYAQRWEFYQLLGKLRQLGRINILDFLCGTPFISHYFSSLGTKVGKDCCLYPSGGDPYMPEPDLVEMGDGCVVDCSSIVCHLNTRGNFELAKIVLEPHVTLRTRSRIQQGVYMEAGSMLLEKSLAMTGEVLDADSVWQGAPAMRVLQYDAAAVDQPQPSTSFQGGIDMIPGMNINDVL